MIIRRPMLAGKVDLSTLKYPVLCTPKLDGIRALKLGGKLVSRNFKEIPNRDIQRKFKDLPEGCDGELIVPERGFNVTSSEVMSRYGEFSGEYFIFDIFIDDLGRAIMDYRYEVRMQMLETIGYDNTHLVLPVKICYERDLLTYTERCLNDGYEGVMIRSPEGPYKEGRSTTKEGYLLKLKRFEDGEAIVLDLEERMTNQNEQTRDAFGLAKRSSHQAGKEPMDMLGALVVQDITSQVRFSVGTGFDEAQRKEIWADRESYRGKIIKYKWQEHGSVDRPRFPVFVGFRS